MKRTWQTRTMAIAGVAAITLYAMHLQIDGALVPIIGAAIISGIAGYSTGIVSSDKITKELREKV